jgi:chromosome segregation ATPase
MDVGPLIQSLEDLQEELQRWSVVAGDALRAADYEQRQTREAVEQMIQRAAIVVDQCERDLEEHSTISGGIDELLQRCSRARATAHDSLQKAHGLLQEAIETLQFWEHELDEALAWLASSEDRLERAQEELEQASQDLHDAERDLNSAESDLEECQRDEERGDCGDEEERVEAAQQSVREAQECVEKSELEVEAAEEEVRQAQARVDCCQRALEYAHKAIEHAETGMAHADRAVNSAERGLECALASQRFAELAQEQLAAEKQVAEQMTASAASAFRQMDEAIVHQQAADLAESEGQRHSTGARYDIADRVEALRAFDGYSTGGTAAVAAATSFGPPTMRGADRPGFSSAALLEQHYLKHRSEFGDISKEEYLELAEALRDAPATPDIRSDRRKNGDIARFDTRTGCFGLFKPSGEIRTFFIPHAGERYYERQREQHE